MANGPIIYVDSNFSLTWVFENTGKGAWPIVHLKRVSGDLDLIATPRPFDNIVEPLGAAMITVDFKAPSKAGTYMNCFRLTHGDNIEFGEKAFLDIEVKDLPVVEGSLLAFDNVFEEKPQLEMPKEDVSNKLLAMMRSQQMLEKFEGDDQIEKSFEIEADAVSVESNEIQIIDDEPFIQEEASEKIQVAEAPVDGVLIQQKAQEVIAEILLDLDKEEIPMEEEPPKLGVSLIDDADTARIVYIEKVSGNGYN